MPQTVEAQMALLKSAVSKRKSRDFAMNVLGIGACVTVLAPWLLGRFVLRDTFFRGNGGVYDAGVRQDGQYFLSDWLMGCSAILLVLALFLIIRPWSKRIGSVVWGFILVGISVFFLIPTSQHAWSDSEFKSAIMLRTTAYPFGDKWYTCGSDTITTADNTLWQVHQARTTNSQIPSDACNRLEVYAGWQNEGTVDLASGEAISKVTITPDGMVTVQTQSGNHGIKFNLKHPQQLL